MGSLSVQHPISLTTLGCGSSIFMTWSSEIRSDFSFSFAFSLRVFTATTEGPLSFPKKENEFLLFFVTPDSGMQFLFFFKSLRYNFVVVYVLLNLVIASRLRQTTIMFWLDYKEKRHFSDNIFFSFIKINVELIRVTYTKFYLDRDNTQMICIWLNCNKGILYRVILFQCA